ncbi:MAG: peptide chain release factor N(5)-glutamine methyltransferase [Candidatus Omnitrophica bacterium]|nr:peptide chain release factor N(5)-glutamine methyltransferase [Candidatus Omnitrophota bacterium]
MNEAELLFTELLNCNRFALYLDKNLVLDKFVCQNIAAILKRRIKAEPLPYILGKIEFMGFEFKLTPDVFIPRPETEILVETVIRYYHLLPKDSRILELGTGSGCIAVSLAKLLSSIDITATDISKEALSIAEENARWHNVENRITFLRSNLFDSLAKNDIGYEMCVSNPPYIPSEEIKRLPPEVRYEPRIALDGGRDGLDFYRRIIDKLDIYLARGGYLIMEMGFGQKEEIEKIFQKIRGLQIKEIVKDYKNIDRVIVLKRQEKDG